MSRPAIAAPPAEQRVVETRVLADNIAARIENRRGTSPIEVVFREEVLRHGVALPEPSPLEAWANEVAARISADTEYDSELRMAERATGAVLIKHFGNSVAVTGPWLEGEMMSINGAIHRITGNPCPGCGVSHECKGQYYLSNYCAACGWFEIPF